MKFKDLNEDYESDLIQEITSKLPGIGDQFLEGLLRDINRRLARPFTGDIEGRDKNGKRFTYIANIFRLGDLGELYSTLRKTDPNDTKKVEKLLKEHCNEDYNFKIKFVKHWPHDDIYQFTGKHPNCPFEIWLERAF